MWKAASCVQNKVPENNKIDVTLSSDSNIAIDECGLHGNEPGRI